MFLLILTAQLGHADPYDLARFVGSYEGTAEVPLPDGTTETRTMNVEIGASGYGFTVQWSTRKTMNDGRIKSKTYAVDFQPSEREGVFAAAMKRNVFGHSVPLDPMAGEPFVWGRVKGDTLTVFSLFIGPDGDYDMQQYDRTLAEGGLKLDYISNRNGYPLTEVHTFLTRQ